MSMHLAVNELLEPRDGSESGKFTCLDIYHFHAEQQHQIYAGTESGRIHTWIVNSQQSIFPETLEHHSQVLPLVPGQIAGRVNAVLCLASQSDRTKCLLFAAGCGSFMHVWKTNQVTNEHLQILEGHSSLVTSLAGCQYGAVVSCDTDGTIKLWGPSNASDDTYTCLCTVFGKSSSTITWHRWIRTVAVNNFTESHLWSCYLGSEEGNILVYRRSADQTRPRMEHHATWHNVHHNAIIRVIAIQGAHGSFVLSSSYDGSCKLLDGARGRICFKVMASQICSELHQAARYFTGLAWDDRSGLICMCNNIGNIEVWSPFSDNKVADFPQPSQVARVSHRLTSNASAFFDLRLSQDRLMYVLSEGRVICCQLSENHQQLYHGHGDEVVAIQVAPQHLPNRRAASMSAAEGVLLTAGVDNKICCWDEYDTELRQTYNDKKAGAKREISSMVVIWQYNAIAIGFDDGCLSVKSIVTAAKHTRHDHTDRIACIHTFSTGNVVMLVTGGLDGCVGAWQVEPIRRGAQFLTMLSLQHPFERGHELVGEHCSGSESVVALTVHQTSVTIFAASGTGLLYHWHLHDNLSQNTANVSFIVEQVSSLACVDDVLIVGCSSGEITLLHIAFGEAGPPHNPILQRALSIPPSNHFHCRSIIAQGLQVDGAIYIATLQGDNLFLWRYDRETIDVKEVYQVRYLDSNPTCIEFSFSTEESLLMASDNLPQGQEGCMLARLFVGFDDGSVLRYRVQIR